MWNGTELDDQNIGLMIGSCFSSDTVKLEWLRLSEMKIHIKFSIDDNELEDE